MVMKSMGKYLGFGAGTAETGGVLELEFLIFFSSFYSILLKFDLMI